MPGQRGRPGESEPDSNDGTYSELSGSAGDVIQARDVRGGVHFHRGVRVDPARGIPRQLPNDVWGFVNRTAELARLDGVFSGPKRDPHVVTVSVITGTAGVGKTSLAIHWAHRIKHRFPDGQFYINLCGYDPGRPVTSDYALSHFLQNLDVPARAIPIDLDAKASMYRSCVAGKRILVVLDNAATVAQVRPLLPGSSSCLVLVTSRNSLPGLSVRDGARLLTIHTLSADDSIRLLNVVTDDYRTQDRPEDLAEMARLCARLPLALRIAGERAARRPQMPLSDLIQDLRDESGLWDALSTDNDENAEAVRTVFAWSYRGLTGETARLFRLLGVHPGPEFSAAAAAAVAGQPAGRVRHLLDELIGAHLVDQISADRYQVHDLLRAYAIGQVEQDESHVACHRILTWYLHTAAAARVTARPGEFAFPVELDPVADAVTPATFSSNQEAMYWYETEKVNLMAAVQAAVKAGFHSIAWKIPAVLGRIIATRDAVGVWLEVERLALSSARRIGDRAGEAIILDNLGIRCRMAGRFAESVEQHVAALAIFQELGNQFGEARSEFALGRVHSDGHQWSDAHARFTRALTIARELDHQTLSAISLTCLGAIAHERGDLLDAESLLQEALSMLREIGGQADESTALRRLGSIRLEEGRVDEARDLVQQAMVVARDCGSQFIESLALIELAMVKITAGEPADALADTHRAANVLGQLGHRSHEARVLDVAGLAYRALGRFDDAMAFHRRAVMTFREQRDNWLLAITLDNFATTLHQAAHTDDARAAWAEAASLTTGFSGPRASALRARVNRHAL